MEASSQDERGRALNDHLKPPAAALKVAHPLMLWAIAAAKKKKEPFSPLDLLPKRQYAPLIRHFRRRDLEVDAKHRVTPLTSRTPISLSPARPLSTLPTSIQSPTIASPLPCAIELNFFNVQHTHPASATERARNKYRRSTSALLETGQLSTPRVSGQVRLPRFFPGPLAGLVLFASKASLCS